MAAAVTPQPPVTPVPAATTISTQQTNAKVTPQPTATDLTVQSQHENTGPPLFPKRQRRPSVRLVEIGDQPAATVSYYSKPPHDYPPWRPQRSDSSSVAKSSRARSLTNFVNGNNSGANTKRVRSNRVLKVDGDIREEESKDFDRQSDSALKDKSDSWKNPVPGPIRDDFDYDPTEPRWRDSSGGEGVMTWLIELGLSRYAPVFEVHEVDDEVLPFLTLEDLKDMGITAVGSRRRLYSAIQKLPRRST